MREYLKIGQILNAMMLPHKQRLARKVKPFTTKDGVFYKNGCNNKLKQFLILERSHSNFQKKYMKEQEDDIL